MEFKVQVTDESGITKEFVLACSAPGESRNLNDFIRDALSISEDKRKLPFMIQCPNGLEVYPSIKMKFEDYGSPLLGNKIEAMHVSWR